GAESIIVCNTVVNAAGLAADTGEAARFADIGIKTITIGDASSPRGLRSCFEDAWSTAFRL
ncbi:MAG: hypothetical protein LBG50_03830, partial [Clostridiales Family XIII bacterium]|nr:hypothetical protein [Clostridiales Family XIII bacterium]